MIPAIKQAAVFSVIFFVSVFFAWFAGSVPDASAAGIEKVAVDQWPAFEDDGGLRRLSDAVSGSIAYYERLPDERPVSFGSDRYTAGGLAAGLRRFMTFLETGPDADELRGFIRENGAVYTRKKDGRPVDVLFTGYFEPEIAGRLERCDTFRYPVYGRPDDLVVVRLAAFSAGCDEKTLVGRLNGKEVVPYFERGEIDDGALEGRAEPVAWVSDPVALFFLHVQGSGRIALEDGRHINVHYDISNGLPYKSIGRYLIDRGGVAAADMSMQAIADYIRNHPEEKKDILQYNPRYIFFKKTTHDVRGALNVALTPERSVALDQSISPPGALLFIKSQKPVCDASGEIEKWVGFSRFAANQDAGAAIRGPGRADLFWGSGEYAQTAAGHMQHPGSIYFIAILPGE